MSATSRRRRNAAICTEPLEQRAMLTTFTVSPDGDNGADGSPGQPFKTIQHALNVAASRSGDDEIHLASAEYQEDLNVNDQSGRVIIKGLEEGASIAGAGADPVVFAQNTENLVLEKLTIRNGTAGLYLTGNGLVSATGVVLRENDEGMILQDFSGSAYVTHSAITENRTNGVRADVAERLQIQKSGVTKNGAYGVLSRSVDNTVLSEVDVSQNGRQGLNVEGGRATQIESSSFNTNRGGGVRIHGSRQRVSITLMTADGNRSDGLELDTIDRATASELTLTGNRGRGAWANNFVGRSSIEIDKANASGNRLDGIALQDVKLVKLKRIEANNNGFGDGFNLAGGNRLIINGFQAENNAGRGIYASQFDEARIRRGASLSNRGTGVQTENVRVTNIDQIASTGNRNYRTGGGISVTRGESFTLSLASIAENIAGSGGGGLYVAGMKGKSTLVDVNISENKAFGSEPAYGGGIYARAAISLTRVEVRDNVARAEQAAGGGVYVAGKNGVLTSSNSLVSGNRVVALARASSKSASARGGGVFVGFGARAVLRKIKVSDNSVRIKTVGNSGGVRKQARGGGIYNNGAKGSTAKIFGESIVTGNEAKDGGGLFGQGVGLRIALDTMFAGNKAASDTDDKGGVWEDV